MKAKKANIKDQTIKSCSESNCDDKVNIAIIHFPINGNTWCRNVFFYNSETRKLICRLIMEGKHQYFDKYCTDCGEFGFSSDKSLWSLDKCIVYIKIDKHKAFKRFNIYSYMLLQEDIGWLRIGRAFKTKRDRTTDNTKRNTKQLQKYKDHEYCSFFKR